MHLPPFLTHKLGPLPVWGWAAGAGAGALAWWYFHRGSAQADTGTVSQQPPDLTGDLGGGGGGGFGGGTGTGGSGTGGNGLIPGLTPVDPQTHVVLPGGPTPFQPPNHVVLPPAPTPVPAPNQYIPGTPPNPGWYQVPSWATPDPNEVVTTPDGVRWIQGAATQQNVLNGSGGYGPVAVSRDAQAFVNTMRLNGHPDIVDMAYLDPTSATPGTAGDAVLTVPGSPGWEFEQGLAHAFEQGMSAGLPPAQAAQAAGVGYLPQGTLPDYINTPQYTSMLYSLPPSAGGLAGLATQGPGGSPIYGGSPAPAPAPAPVPMISGGQPVGGGYSMANPNPNEAPYPPPAPPPIPGGGSALSYSGFNGVPGGPIGLTFG